MKNTLATGAVLRLNYKVKGTRFQCDYMRLFFNAVRKKCKNNTECEILCGKILDIALLDDGFKELSSVIHFVSNANKINQLTKQKNSPVGGGKV